MVQRNSNLLILFLKKRSLDGEFKVGTGGQIFCLATLDQRSLFPCMLREEVSELRLILI